MSHTPVSLRLFTANYFHNGFLFDGHQKLLIAPAQVDALNLAWLSHPLFNSLDLEEGDILVEEVSRQDFKERLGELIWTAPNKNWLDVAL